jgi:peptidoglycan lytic transglycosylase
MNGFPRLRLIVGVLALVALAGCAAKSPTGGASTGYKVGKPYQIDGIWYYPQVDYAYSETGIASWYGPGFHGKATANGEPYDQNSLTAAHRTLPLPSMVRVTNLENGRQLALRVNDRGPFARGRILDVSRRAAQLLGFEQNGTARVRVEIMAEESRQMAYNAGVYSLPPAQPAGSAGASTAGSPQVAAAPTGQVAEETLPALPGSQSAPAKPVQPAVKPITPAVPIEDKVLQGNPQPDGKVTKVPVRATNMYVQAGAFTNQGNAYRLVRQLMKLGPTKIVPIIVGNQRFYRVRVGPIGSLAEADRILGQVVDAGNEQARIVVE